MAQAFDPYAMTPNWAAQGGDVVNAWKQAIAKLNFQKNTVMDKYGFKSEGDVNPQWVEYNPDGTVKGVGATGGMTGVNQINDFVGKDNQTGIGGFRDELTAEANMMDAADNGPSRGFSGGLSNQAGAAARQAATRAQQGFTQGYNQFAAGVNQSGLETTNSANTNIGTITQNQTDWASNEAAWQSTIPSYTAGVSGGGTTPIGAKGAAVNAARSMGYGVNTGYLNKQKAVTFAGTNGPTRREGPHGVVNPNYGR